jgi:RIO kinase 1
MSEKRHIDSILSEGGFKREELREHEARHLNEAFNRWITDVEGVINDGKEATVYCCRARGTVRTRYHAAKVFRARKFRAFRKDRDYYIRRHGVDQRRARAMAGGTQRGRGMGHSAWVRSEWDALCTLHAAGADVPRPVDRSDDAILMEHIGRGSRSAPMLVHVRLDPPEAEAAFEAILRNVEIMLGADLLHGDLSAFNVLYDAGRIVVIDVPQAVDLKGGEDPWPLLLRDVRNICTHFGRQGLERDPEEIAADLWERYQGAEL